MVKTFKQTIRLKTEVTDLNSLNEIYIWSNKTIMEFESCNVEEQQDKLLEWATMLQNTYQLEGSTRPASDVPSLKYQSATLRYQTKERGKEKSTIYQLVDKLWRAP